VLRLSISKRLIYEIRKGVLHAEHRPNEGAMYTVRTVFAWRKLAAFCQWQPSYHRYTTQLPLDLKLCVIILSDDLPFNEENCRGKKLPSQVLF